MKNIKLLSLILCVFSIIVLIPSCVEDPCENVICLNDGVCLDGTCDCPDGASGTTCETIWRAQLIGSQSVSEECSLGSSVSYDVTIAAAGTGFSDITLSNMYNVGFVGSATMTDANNFTFTSETQTINGSDWTLVSGSGVISGSTVTITYTIELNGGTDTCTTTFTL